MEITVDTNVLVAAIEEADPDALEFVHSYMRRNVIVLDHERDIDQEYRGQFRNNGHSQKCFWKWWKVVSNKADRYVRYTSKPCAEDKEEFERVRFDGNDWKFAAVCVRSADKVLVSEDTDYDCVRDYLAEKRQVTIKRVNEILTG